MNKQTNTYKHLGFEKYTYQCLNSWLVLKYLLLLNIDVKPQTLTTVWFFFVSQSSVKLFYFTESLLICYNPAWLVLRCCEIEMNKMSTIQASSIQHSSSNVGVEEYRTASAGTSVGVC